MKTLPSARSLPIVTDLPPSLLREIGRICVAYSRIEWLLNKMIYDVLNVTPQEGRLAVRDPSPDQRLDLLQDLMDIKHIKTETVILSELKTILQECKTKRDAVAHGIWLREPGTRILFLRLVNGTWSPPGTRGKIKRRMHLESIEFDTHEATLYTAHIETTFKVVSDLHDELVAEIGRMIDAGKLPEKRSEQSLHADRIQGQTDDTQPPQPKS